MNDDNFPEGSLCAEVKSHLTRNGSFFCMNCGLQTIEEQRYRRLDGYEYKITPEGTFRSKLVSGEKWEQVR